MPEAEQTLRAMSEHGDIIRAMQRTLGNQKREYAVWDVSRGTTELSGRIIGKRLSDELQDQGFLMIEGETARVHYLKLPRTADLSAYKIGSHIRVKQPPSLPRYITSVPFEHVGGPPNPGHER